MSHSRAEDKVGSNTLIPPLHARQLPQGLVYAVVVAAVAAWSWDRWESAHSTAIAALAASAFMLVLELALSSVSPWVARTVFGLRGLRTFTPVGRASAALPADEAEAGAPVEITEQELDGLRQAYARMLGEVEQLVAVSRDARPAPSTEELGERGWDAVAEPKPATSANLDDGRAPRITDRPWLTGSNIVFAILSVAALTLFVVFVVVLVTA